MVTTVSQLFAAMKVAKASDTVYIAPGEYDLTVPIRAEKRCLELPSGVTLKGDRKNPSLIYSDDLGTYPLIKPLGPGCKIVGLRIQGSQSKVYTELDALPSDKYYAFPMSAGIVSAYSVAVEHCEIYGWGHSGVYCHGTQQSPSKLAVHACNIHHCQRSGLGYGVCVGDWCEALIDWCEFDYTRHAIACTGHPESGYEARNCKHGTHCTHYVFDMHPPGGKYMHVHGCDVRTYHPAVTVQGKPVQSWRVENCRFLDTEDDAIIVWNKTDASGVVQAAGNVYGE